MQAIHLLIWHGRSMSAFPPFKNILSYTALFLREVITGRFGYLQTKVRRRSRDWNLLPTTAWFWSSFKLTKVQLVTVDGDKYKLRKEVNLIVMYKLLTKCEVNVAGYWPSSFSACLWTEIEYGWKTRTFFAQSMIYVLECWKSVFLSKFQQRLWGETL